MSVKVENLEHNMAKLTVTVDAARFTDALKKAYNRQKKSISVPGFRKGKVPQQIIEKMYGPSVFYEDGADILLNEEYPRAYEESGLDIVSQPKIDLVQVEKGKDFIFTAEVAVKPEVKLGKYKGVTVTKIDTKASDEEVEKAIDAEREQNARQIKTEDAAKERDTVNINFEGFVDGKAFEGGKGENYDLVLGSHSFIDNFEDQLVGKKAGEDVNVNVTFPEKYQAEELQGKAAEFKVHINSVTTKELPELNDEFVQDVSEFDNVDDFRKSIVKRIEDNKEASAKQAKEDEAVAKIAADSEMDIPDAMIDTQVQSMLGDFDQRMRAQGLTLQQYLQFTGTTVESMKEQLKPEALKRIQSTLVLEAIAKEENIEVTDEDIDAEVEKIAKQYGMKAEDIKKDLKDEDKKNLSEDIKIEKAVDLVMENVKERAKAKKAAKADSDENEEKKTKKKASSKKTKEESDK